jgi:hypothetical protein
MRYGACLIDSRRPLSLSACEFRTSPVAVPDRPNYGLLPNRRGKPHLYSVRDIERDEIIAENPVQVVPTRQFLALRSVGLEDLCFDWNRAGCVAVSLGAGAFIGHSDEPNCYWRADYFKRTVSIYPRRPIFAGEELTIDYSTDTRRPCRDLQALSVARLPVKDLPKPELPKVVVTHDVDYGRTLIAVRNIRAGETISEAPVRVISNHKLDSFTRILALTDLAHDWLNRFCAIVLGIPALVNHSYSANAFYRPNRRRRTISLVAYKSIAAGYEVTMNYNGHPNDQSPLDWNSTERDAPLKISLLPSKN